MTKKEFERIEEDLGFTAAMRELMREERWVLDYEGYKEYIIEVIEDDKLEYAGRMLADLGGYTEEDEAFWWKRKKGKLPNLLSSYEDVEFLLEDDDEWEWSPDRDDEWCHSQGIM